MASIEAENGKIFITGEDISPDRDKGLMKEIIRQSINDDKPLFDDQVFIHYVGSELDGKIFVNSRDRNEKFSFSLGKGDVIPAWDLGVATMKRGEIARFFSTPKYAYGLKGEKKYRSATNVIFEIELLDFIGKDISEEQDGSIIRRIICRGEGRQSPNEDATVDINLKGIYQEKIFDERTVEFIVGLPFLEHIPLGVDRAVCKMLRNEHCRLVLKDTALQGLEKFSIPMDGLVQYEITLNKFERFEEERLLSDKEKLEQAELLKQRADHLVKNGYYETATKRYKIVANLLSSGTLKDRNDRIKSQQLKIAAQSNLSLCYLKLGDYLQCKNFCDAALALDPNNEKCLFRRGQAQFSFNNFEQAIKDFQTVLKINPSNAAAQQQIEYCHERSKQQKTKEKESYQAFFNDPSKASLFEKDEQYDEAKKNMKEHNPLRALGLEPVSLESLGLPAFKKN